MSSFANLDQFAQLIYDLLKSDRDNNVGVGGFTGEGKSTFLTGLFKSYAKASSVPWNFHQMTWSRNEMLQWIDGEKGAKANSNGLKKGQLSEYSGILCDELWLLFYKRNWYDEGQIDAIGTLNMCRDRHLLIGGCVPNFWDLDSAFTSRIRFYVYIPFRGTAWIFEQENNPFASDPWNKNYNKKIFRKNRKPYKIPNFICEIQYPDWTPDEKIEYYKIRNKKRLLAFDQNTSEKKERYSSIKRQRDELIRMMFNDNQQLIKYPELIKELEIGKLTNKAVSEILGLSQEAIRKIRLNIR